MADFSPFFSSVTTVQQSNAYAASSTVPLIFLYAVRGFPMRCGALIAHAFNGIAARLV